MIIAFNFDKINIERKSLLKGKVEIKNKSRTTLKNKRSS